MSAAVKGFMMAKRSSGVCRMEVKTLEVHRDPDF